MSFWAKLSKMDNRIIYTALLVVLIGALIFPIGLPLPIGPSAKAAYDLFDNWKEGDILYISFDYDSAGATDIQSSIESVMRLVFRHKGRVITGGLWAIGAQQANYAFKKMLVEFPDLVEGTDYLNIGYKPGGSMFIEKALDDMAQACANVDNNGRNLNSFPIMKDFPNLKSAAAVMSGDHGSPGTADWVPMYSTAYGIANKKPYVVAGSAVTATNNVPFVQSGQITIFLNGIRAGAEMETLTGKLGTAVSGMDAQSLSHILVLFLIVLGNISYFVLEYQETKSRKG